LRRSKPPSTLSHRALALGHRFADHPRVHRLLYALRNRRGFTDLYQHDRMLADEARIDAYRDAFARHVKADDVVVDLGTGTGVLAFLAARSGARVVHAIEHGVVVELAEAVARDNGIENVEFHRMHSTTFELDEKADVIIHEQIGDALFDEGVIANIGDLRDRVLKPGGLILPGRLELFVEPVQLLDGLNAPFAWQQQIEGIDFRALANAPDAESHGYRYRVFRPFPFQQFLCETEPVLEIDLLTVDPADTARLISYERPVTVPGRIDGLCVYFRASFDDEISFSSSPEERPTNWGTPLWRVEPRDVAPGDSVRLDLEARDLASPRSWRWQVSVG
jgi:type I protein arginine methyltransferase